MQEKRRNLCWLIASLACAAAPMNCVAFGLAPFPDKPMTRSWFDHVLHAISDPQGKIAAWMFDSGVHERITHAAYGCDKNAGKDCDNDVSQGLKGAPMYVLEGVQWNDNPPFTITWAQSRNAPTCVGLTIRLPNLWPGCWAMVFTTAEQTSGPPGDGVTFGPEAPILQRSHFGDMQFLHAMAPDGETAEATQQKIMAWARFAYLVAEGKIAANTIVSSKDAGPGAQFFPVSRNPEFKDLTVGDLFTFGLEDQSPQRVMDMAFGSLLHVIEDSFAKGHVERELPQPSALRPGRVIEFHSYAHQDHGRHKDADHEDAFEAGDTKPYVIEAVRRVAQLRGAGWEKVEPVLKEIFCLVEPARAAGPGKAFASRVVPIPQPDAR